MLFASACLETGFPSASVCTLLACGLRRSKSTCGSHLNNHHHVFSMHVCSSRLCLACVCGMFSWINHFGCWQAAVAEVIAGSERIDIVINNAGVALGGPIVELDMALLKRSFETNCFAPVEMAQAVFPHMEKRRAGLIVNVSSGMSYAYT